MQYFTLMTLLYFKRDLIIPSQDNYYLISVSHWNNYNAVIENFTIH